MRLIETPLALMALWKMAEYLPAGLLEMEKEEPEELLRMIEHKVEMAMNWRATAMRNGATEDGSKEIMHDLLNPSYCPEEPEEIPISDQQMERIHQKLIKIAQREKL
jgi:hypothetical protein